ncbi:hypothetical protein [Mycolicibacterium hodleri]|uniref:hypothetical protein n=1 Tax=Mycolicibacterium hodleri TaxID=49897 RepID=UPI00163C8693|nr:hypothetical protein [Mycolicibacterium hodleri]
MTDQHDDDDDELVVQRVVARMRARGMHPVVDADPAEVRRQLRADATAAQALWFGLAGLEPGVVAAITHASTPCTCCTDDVGWAAMALEVFRAADVRLRGAARRVLDDPDIRAATTMLPTCCARDWSQVALRVWRVINRLRDTLTDTERANLRLSCVDGDLDFELRCLRAGYVTALGQIIESEDMVEAGSGLALREGYERPHGGLSIPAVQCVAASQVWAMGCDVAPDTHAERLRAELVRVDSLMVYPAADVGGGAP